MDHNPLKQGKYTPGAYIPILDSDAIRNPHPHYIFTLPWNLQDEINEISTSMNYVRDWGCEVRGADSASVYSQLKW